MDDSTIQCETAIMTEGVSGDANRCSSCHSDSERSRSLLILPSVGSGRLYGMLLPCCITEMFHLETGSSIASCAAGLDGVFAKWAIPSKMYFMNLRHACKLGINVGKHTLWWKRRTKIWAFHSLAISSKRNVGIVRLLSWTTRPYPALEYHNSM